MAPTSLQDLGERSRAASLDVGRASTAARDAALQAAADLLEARVDSLLFANAVDVEAAEKAGAAPLRLWIACA